LSGGINLGIQETLRRGVRAFGKGAYDSWQQSAEWVSQQPLDLRQRGGSVGEASATWLVIRGSTGDGTSVVDGHEFRFRYTVQADVTLSVGSGGVTTFPTITQPPVPDDDTHTAWNLTEWLNVSSSGVTKLGPGDVIGAGYYPTGVEGIVRGFWVDDVSAFVFFASNPMTSWAQEARLGAP
tara:strand:+ start:4692 stop:5234 length:543 start_codon:yes stop_codon:yes gene_type:complete